MILLIDNYDSFVYNLARYFRELGQETEVVRNDAITVDEIRDRRPQALILSPGPCTPSEAGVSVDAVRRLADQLPILGVCLGHQAIAAALGAQIVRAPEPVHGRTSAISHFGTGLFIDISNPFTATRYHSLIVDEDSLPDSLSVSARTDDGIVMAVAHRDWPLVGVQFHPESVLTDAGHRLLSNFLDLSGIRSDLPPTSKYSESATALEDFYRQPIVCHDPRPM